MLRTKQDQHDLNSLAAIVDWAAVCKDAGTPVLEVVESTYLRNVAITIRQGGTLNNSAYNIAIDSLELCAQQDIADGEEGRSAIRAAAEKHLRRS